MITLNIFVFIILFFYLIFIGLIISGQEKLYDKSFRNDDKPTTKLSIIIAARNEESTITHLLKDLSNQSYPKNLFEIIVIDDNSTDSTFDVVNKLKPSFENLKILKNTFGEGKKTALLLGIKNAIGDLLIFTDADCRLSTDWLNEICAVETSGQYQILLAPVLYESKPSIFNRLLELENLILLCFTAGSAGLNRPLLSNGANIAVSKKLFENYSDPYNSFYTSGDDIFIMQHLKKSDACKINFLLSEKATVHTSQPKNFTEFWNQRKRWISKSGGYKDTDIKISALVLLCMNLCILTFAVLSIFSLRYFGFLAIIFFIKCFADYVMLIKIASFFNRTYLLKYLTFLEILYPIYIFTLIIHGQFSKFEWKGRIYSK